MEPPDGFSCDVIGDECVIEHQRRGMGCLNLFLSVWLSIWTVACCALVFHYFNGGKMEDGSPMAAWFVLLFLAAWVFVAGFLAYCLYARKTFRLLKDCLEIETQVLFFKWTAAIPRKSILAIEQVKDGGVDEDSFPSWGFRINWSFDENKVRTQGWITRVWQMGRVSKWKTILYRLPYDHSFWLAGVLGNWVGVVPELCAKE